MSKCVHCGHRAEDHLAPGRVYADAEKNTHFSLVFRSDKVNRGCNVSLQECRGFEPQSTPAAAVAV